MLSVTNISGAPVIIAENSVQPGHVITFYDSVFSNRSDLITQLQHSITNSLITVSHDGQAMTSAQLAQLFTVSATLAQGAGADVTGMAIEEVIRHPFVAGVGGTAVDDVIFNANAPYAFQIVDCYVDVSNVGGGAGTAQLRTATAGGGSVLSKSFSTASLALVREDGSATSHATVNVPAGGSLVLRRSDNTTVGEIIISCMKT